MSEENPKIPEDQDSPPQKPVLDLPSMPELPSRSVSMPLMDTKKDTIQADPLSGTPEEEEGAAGTLSREEELHPAGPSTRPDSPDVIQPAPSSHTSSIVSIHAAHPDGASRVSQRVWNVVEPRMKRVGLPTCVLHRSMRLKVACKACDAKKQHQKYEQLEEEAEAIDLAAQAAEGRKSPVTIPFYFEQSYNFDLEEAYNVPVHKDTIAYDALTVLSNVRVLDEFFSYSVVELWETFSAERYLDDGERLFKQFWEHEESGQKFRYLLLKSEKFEYSECKDLYFITPERASKKFAESTTDPNLIQVWHKYFQKPLVSQEPVKPKVSKKRKMKTFFSRSRSISDSTSPSIDEFRRRDETPPEPDIPEKEQANPIYCSTVYVRQSNVDHTVREALEKPGKMRKIKWEKKYLLLRNRILYFVTDHATMMKFYLMENDNFARALRKMKLSSSDHRALQFVGFVHQLDAYKGLNLQKYYNAPLEDCIILRQHITSKDKPIIMMFCPRILKVKFETEDIKAMGQRLWLTAIRVAKQGLSIVEDFFRHRANCMKYDLQLTFAADMEPKVPMDFSSGTGRLLDVREAKQEYTKPRVLRFEQYEQCPIEAFANGAHLTQKYYHENISRTEAEAKLQAAATNGSWLLRNSSSRKHFLIISYIYEGRFHHKYISVTPYIDQSSESGKNFIFLATLNHVVAFYDVHSLLEYHRLNKSDELLCMLGMSVKNPNQPDSSPLRSQFRHTKPVAISSRNSSSEQSLTEKSSKSLKGLFSKGPSKPKSKSKDPLSAGSSLEPSVSIREFESAEGSADSVSAQASASADDLSTEAAAESLSSDPSEKPSA